MRSAETGFDIEIDLSRGKIERVQLLRDFLSNQGLFQRTGLRSPLTCDMYESDPPLDEPMCVKWCLADALTYEEREEEVQKDKDEEKREEMEIGLESLANKFGFQKLMDAVARMSMSKKEE